MAQLAGYHVKTTASRHEPGSVRSQPAYGLGTFAVLVIPALVPGITERQLIIGYVGAVAIIYFTGCVPGILGGLKYHRVYITSTSSEAA